MEQLRTALHAPHLGNQQKSNQRVFEAWRKSELLHASRDESAPEKDDSTSSPAAMDDSDASSRSEEDDDERDEQRDSTEIDDELLMQQHEHETREVRELRLRHHQLQDDVEVLAAHLEKQTSEHEKERAAMHLLQNQLQHANMEMARELHSFRIENEALRRQNALLQTQRDEFQQKASVAAETQEELLLALKKQQQNGEQLQNANVHIVRERAQVRKALETTQNHCRRLEEELAAVQTLVMQLQSERTALLVAAKVASATTHNRDAEQIKLQDEMISSLRADLLQMEFEYKTLTVDRDALSERVSKLQKRASYGNSSESYDVIPLGNENGGFSGVMELPNFVGDREDSSSSIGSSSSSLPVLGDVPPLRRRSSFSALVSKTVSSAKKKLFVPSQNKTVLPQ